MNERNVAILGASSDRTKYGNKSVRAHAQQGYYVYPVNPKGGEIEGWEVYRTVQEIPVDLHRISVYLPPALTAQLLPAMAEKGCDELWLNPGSENSDIIEQAKRLGLRTIAGCSIVDLGVSPADFPD